MFYSASFSEASTYQYHVPASQAATVGDAFEAAKSELKRKGAPINLEEVRLLGVVYKDKGRQLIKSADLKESMKAGYELQLQTGDQTLQENLAEKEAFQRLMLEPQVIDLASTFTARIISGKARSGSEPSSGGMKAFMLKNEENSQLVRKLTQVARLDCSPDEFAEFADKNYTLRNDDQHNSLDEFLIGKARKLKAAGAVRLLHSELSWQCSLIANMEELLECLKEAS